MNERASYKISEWTSELAIKLVWTSEWMQHGAIERGNMGNWFVITLLLLLLLLYRAQTDASLHVGDYGVRVSEPILGRGALLVVQQSGQRQLQGQLVDQPPLRQQLRQNRWNGQLKYTLKTKSMVSKNRQSKPSHYMVSQARQNQANGQSKYTNKSKPSRGQCLV